jgi:cardiolipin synthase (CMP-forming)
MGSSMTAKGGSKAGTMWTLPNILTLSRIVAVPVLVALMWTPEPLPYAFAFALYAIVGVTDYFDGWLARRMGSVSKLGAFLDPIADKIMVASVLLMLTAVDRIDGVHVVAAIAILLREIMVSGLREFLGGRQVSMPVSRLAKWKTTFQMIAQGALILAVATPDLLWMQWVGLGSLWAAAALTVITGWDYLRIGLRHMH